MKGVLEETLSKEHKPASGETTKQDVTNEADYIVNAKEPQYKDQESESEQRKYLIENSTKREIFLCIYGIRAEAANNPNSVPVLTAIQGLSLLSAYLKDNDMLVLREHPHMLDGSKQFAWEKGFL